MKWRNITGECTAELTTIWRGKEVEEALVYLHHKGKIIGIFEGANKFTPMGGDTSYKVVPTSLSDRGIMWFRVLHQEYTPQNIDTVTGDDGETEQFCQLCQKYHTKGAKLW